jgi:hypothetical protein
LSDYDDFPAKDPDSALTAVLKDFETFLEHTTLEKPIRRRNSGKKVRSIR